MATVIAFPSSSTVLSERERAHAASLSWWLQALESPLMQADLCIECARPTEDHFDQQRRYGGCAYAMRERA